MNTQFLSIGETTEYLKTNRPRLIRYMKRLDIKTYQSRVDHRAKVLRIEDVELIAQAMQRKGTAMNIEVEAQKPLNKALDITR